MSLLEGLPPNALINVVYEDLWDRVHFLTRDQLMKLIPLNYLVRRKLTYGVRFPLLLSGGLPKLIDIQLRYSNPAIVILDSSPARRLSLSFCRGAAHLLDR